MSRGMHRHRSIRRTNLAAHKIATRKAKAPGKTKAGARRDARALAVIKVTPAGTAHAPWVQSWLSRRIGCAYTRLTPEAIAAVLA
jgi:hypothetical protein